MKRSYYDDFILVVGTREDIIEIAKIIYNENAQKVIEGLSEGKYVLLNTNRCMDIDAKQIKEKYPSCELFVYKGAGRHGCCDYELSYAGDCGVLEDTFYVLDFPLAELEVISLLASIELLLEALILLLPYSDDFLLFDDPFRKSFDKSCFVPQSIASLN